MAEEKKVDRRSFLSYAITAVVVGVVAGVGGYYAGLSSAPPPGAPTTVTRTVTPPAVTTTVTPPPVTTTVTATAKPPEQPVKSEILVGATMSLTGVFAAFGPFYKAGYEKWVEDVNAKGGLLGGRLKLILYDDKSDATTAVGLYEKLITADKVDLIVGPYSSTISAAVQPVAEKYKKVLPMGAAGALELYQRGYKYSFSVSALALSYAVPIFDWMKTLPEAKRPKSVALPYTDTLFSSSIIDGARDLAKKEGVKIVFDEKYPVDVKDLVPIVRKIKDANPDIIIAGTYYVDAVLMVKALEAIKYRPKLTWVAIAVSLPTFGKELGPLAEGIVGDFQYWETMPFERTKEIWDWFTKKEGSPPPQQLAQGYACGQILEQAVKATGSLDNEKLMDWLHRNEVKTALGHYKFAENGIGYPAMWIGMWKEGKRVIVWPPSAAEAPMPYKE